MERKTHRESWKGEESVKERFTLKEDKMVPYLEGEFTLEQAQADLKAKASLSPAQLPCPLCPPCPDCPDSIRTGWCPTWRASTPWSRPRPTSRPRRAAHLSHLAALPTAPPCPYV